MTVKYLLDTNVLSEAKRPQPNQNVIPKFFENIACETGFHKYPLGASQFIF